MLDSRFGSVINRRWNWVSILLFLTFSRLLLNIPILIGANWFPLRGPVNYKSTFPEVWARWDSGYYLNIARNGYTFRGDEVNFFPMYPITIWGFSFGVPSIVFWVGFLISNFAFILAAVLLWEQVSRDFNISIAWTTVVTLSLFPTSFFFSAIYTESLFLLFSVLVYFFSARRHYLLAGLFVSLASTTRITGILLIAIPLIEILISKPPRWRLQIIITGLISGIGFSIYGLYLWLTQGTPLAFITTQQENMKRSITWPGQSLMDSLGVIIWGHGGFENNWFMRVVSVQDFLAISLFIICAILGIFLLQRKSLIIYFWFGIFMLLVSHGPYTLGVYAMARYVLVLFPGFIVIGILLDGTSMKWVAWGISGIILVFLTAWFGNGGWVA